MSESRVQAILSVQDQGYFSAMERAKKAAEGMGSGLETAGKNSNTFMQTLGGMASALGITTLISKGFNMVSDSVGKAIARIDTMDGFNRTMTLMTGSSDKAESALERLKESATGTAYGLDVTARATQGLVTSGMDIKDSTRYVGGWMDAVSTYGDGTNATLSNVMFQLSQMASKGKANLGDLKSAMEAGIPVIQMYAEATGQSANDVSDQISKGSISASDFMETIDKAFKEGTRSFAGISGAAKNAGATWQGTFDNMQAATTRGMISIINAIEDARADQGLPGMKDAITEFGRNSEQVLNAVAKVAGFAAQHFDTLSFALTTGLSAWAGYKIVGEVSDKLTKFKSATELAGSKLEMFFRTQRGGNSIQSAFYNALNDSEGKMMMQAAAQKLNIALTKTNSDGIVKAIAITDAQKFAILAETGALTAKSVIMGVLSGKIKLTTAAQLLWNMAIKANPIGMIVAGAAALAAGLVFLNKKLNATSAEHKIANKAAQDMADSNNALVKSSESLGKSYEENSVDARANAEEAKRMVNGLVELQNATMDTEEKQMRMKNAVNQLNSAYPELNVELDKTGTAIKGSTDAIYAQIDAMQEQAKMEAMKEYLKDLYKQQIEYEVSIEATNKQMAEMEAQGQDTQSVLFGMGEKTTKEFKELEKSSGELGEGFKETSNKIAEMEGALKVTSEAQLQNQLEQDRQKESLQSLNDAYGVTTFAIKEYADNSGKELEKIGEKVLELSAKYDMSTDKIMAGVDKTGLSLEDWAKRQEQVVKVGEKFDMTADEIEAALEKSGYALDDWAKRQDELFKIADKYDLTTDQIEKAVAEQKISLEQFAENHENNLKKAEKAIDTYVGNATNGWGRLKQESTISLDDYIKNLEENRKATEKWTQNMDILMKAGVDGAIIQHLESMGPAGAAQAEVFVKELEKLNGGVLGSWDELDTKTQNKLNDINKTQVQSIEAGGRAARTSLEAQDYPDMGAAIIGGMKDGMTREMSGLEKKALVTGGSVTTGINKGIDKQKLKLDMIESGQIAMDGMKTGLDSTRAKVAAVDVKNKLIEGLSPAEIERKMLEAGTGAVDGLVEGADPNKAKKSAQEMRKQMLEGMQKDGLKREMMATGLSAVDGFDDGINKMGKPKASGEKVKTSLIVGLSPEEIKAKMLEAGKGGINALDKGLSKDGAKKSGEDISRMVKMGLNKSELETHLRETGRFAMTGLDIGLDKGKANTSGAEVRRNMLLGLNKQNIRQQMLDTGVVGIDGIKAGLSPTRAQAAGAAVKSSVLSGLNSSGMRGSMVSTGRNAMNGLDAGLEDRRYSIYKTAESIARGVTGRFAAVMQIKSPSRIFRGFGQNIDKGLVLGMEDGFRDIDNATKRMAEKASNFDYSIPSGQIGDSQFSNSVNNKPAEITLALGKQTYKAFVNDIGRALDEEVSLELKYT